MMMMMMMMMVVVVMMKCCLRHRITVRFYSSTCTMLSTCTSYAAIYLYDAVYLYLRTLNQTLAEGYSNYRDGHLIHHKSIGQRFVGKCSTGVYSSVAENLTRKPR